MKLVDDYCCFISITLISDCYGVCVRAYFDIIRLDIITLT